MRPTVSDLETRTSCDYYELSMSTTLVVVSSVQYYGLNSTHDNRCCTHQTAFSLYSFCFLLQFLFFFYFSRNLLGHRKDASIEDDETIVNHFHGVSSSSESRGFLFFRRISTSPQKLCTRHTSVRQMMLSSCQHVKCPRGRRRNCQEEVGCFTVKVLLNPK